MEFRKHFDFLNVFKYLTLFMGFLIFTSLSKTPAPFNLSLYFCALYFNCSLIVTPILCVLSFIPVKGFNLLLPVGISIAFLTIVFLIYRLTKTKMNGEAIIYVVLSFLPYALMGDFAFFEERMIISVISSVLTFICFYTTKAVSIKGLKLKMNREELLCISIMVIAFGIGVSNLLGVNFYKTLSLYLVLFCAFLYKTGIGAIISTILSISLCIYFNNPVFAGVYLIWYLTILTFMDKSRFFSAILVVATDILLQAVFSIYPVYSYSEVVFMIAGSLCFCLTPTKFLKNLKEKLYSFREKQLVRQTINRNRIMLSNKLYDISNVFLEIADTFNSFKKNGQDKTHVNEIMEKSLIESVCKNCDSYKQCLARGLFKDNSFKKLLEIGLAKGKVSFIDFPRNITDYCISTNAIIFNLNKLLAEYRSKALNDINMANGRAIIGAQALGISDVLKGLALETSQTLKYQSRLERALSTKLYENGILVNELLIYGEEEKAVVNVLLSMNEVSLTLLEKTVSEVIGFNFTVVEKSLITENKIFFSLKKSQSFDAVIGINAKIKDGSMTSGDTHSLIKISESKFLIALSDGMGSGEYAKSISGLALSLIESFYKAGMSSNLILTTVNRILAINTEDSFTALDIAVVDLETQCVDFIKYGAPYGFIINDNGIKLIESGMLPLGILEEIKPSITSTQIQNGDMLLLFTDGISDAFGSSADMLEYLRTLPAKNPQTLADEIMEKAVLLNDGIKKDDMTTLAVRIFEKNAS